jgi:hypothetical protein
MSSEESRCAWADGTLSVVQPLPSQDEQAVALTSYPSMRTLKENFALIEAGEFQSLGGENGFRVVDQETRSVTWRKGAVAWCFRQNGVKQTVSRVCLAEAGWGLPLFGELLNNL